MQRWLMIPFFTLMTACLPGTIPPESTSTAPSEATRPSPTRQVIEAIHTPRSELITQQPTATVTRKLIATETPTMATGSHQEIENLPEEKFVTEAKKDLAKRLSISIDEIELVAFDQVTWNDGSLGCPEPGMLYTQALVNGHLIRLSANNIPFDYHQGGNRPPFLCTRKNPRQETNTDD